MRTLQPCRHPPKCIMICQRHHKFLAVIKLKEFQLVASLWQFDYFACLSLVHTMSPWRGQVGPSLHRSVRHVRSIFTGGETDKDTVIRWQRQGAVSFQAWKRFSGLHMCHRYGRIDDGASVGLYFLFCDTSPLWLRLPSSITLGACWLFPPLIWKFACCWHFLLSDTQKGLKLDQQKPTALSKVTTKGPRLLTHSNVLTPKLERGRRTVCYVLIGTTCDFPVLFY